MFPWHGMSVFGSSQGSFHPNHSLCLATLARASQTDCPVHCFDLNVDERGNWINNTGRLKPDPVVSARGNQDAKCFGNVTTTQPNAVGLKSVNRCRAAMAKGEYTKRLVTFGDWRRSSLVT